MYKRQDVLNNVGDLLIPEGTKVAWELHTENSEELSFILQDKSHDLSIRNNLAYFNAIVKKSGNYQVVPKNTFVSNSDYLSHQINIITDQYPSISVIDTPDSMSTKAVSYTHLDVYKRQG